ncbi:MAG TPA: hypothetical protein VNA24_23715 [Hyalangium sp.]|nr:hypothetical protein [Hyalangium sp.]
MSLRAVMQGLLMAVLVGACASPSKVERPVGPSTRFIFQSPIALLLEHHGELLLTTDQMIVLGKQDLALKEKNRPLRELLREARRRDMEREEGPVPDAGIGGGGWGRGGGMGGHGMRGHGKGGKPRSSIQPMDEESLRQLEATLREIDDNEYAAYNEAEQILDEKQKVRARELVSQQREERMLERESMRRRLTSPHVDRTGEEADAARREYR